MAQSKRPRSGQTQKGGVVTKAPVTKPVDATATPDPAVQPDPPATEEVKIPDPIVVPDDDTSGDDAATGHQPGDPIADGTPPEEDADEAQAPENPEEGTEDGTEDDSDGDTAKAAPGEGFGIGAQSPVIKSALVRIRKRYPMIAGTITPTSVLTVQNHAIVRKVQQRLGLEVVGDLTPETLAALDLVES